MQATPPNSLKHSIRALENRGLAKVRRRSGAWTAELTDDGRHYAAHGDYPPLGEAAKPRPESNASESSPPAPASVPEPDFEVDSPAGMRARGRKPHGDALRSADEPDPWDARVLISVKEAAWLLSLNEHAIRRAVRDGDIDRVFIGRGTTHYRIVYGSLLAWVNAMPREQPSRQWWSAW
jgi:excisionase family DNA binding protein